MSENAYNGMPATALSGVRWFASTHGGPGGGVELARLDDGRIAMRNAADPDGPVLICAAEVIAALIGGAKNGDFDDLAG